MRKIYHFILPAFIALGLSTYAQDTYTEVCGVLSENTTWTKQNSPYYLKNCNLAVAASITLTIEAGVTVIIDPTRRLIVDGSLVVSGATNDSVVFRSSGAERFTEIYFRTGSTGHLTGFSLSGAVNGVRAEGAQISINKGAIRYCQTGVRLLNATAALSETSFKYNATGAIFANDSQTSGTISSCQFIGNTAGDYASAIYLGSGASFTITGSTFTANTATAIEINDNRGKRVESNTFEANVNAVKVSNTKFTGNSVTRNKGFGLLATSSSVESNLINENDGHGVQGANGCTIVNNTINDNKGSGIQCAGFNTIEHNRISRNAADGIVEVGSSVIRYNTITANVGDGVRTSSLPTINHNNIYQNTGYNVNATKESNETINAKSNYWGTTVSAQIAAKIHDYYDDGMSVKVDYSDFASQDINYPIIISIDVLEIGLNFAQLDVRANANGPETQVILEWGLTTAYGNEVNLTSEPLSGHSNVSLITNLADLESGKTYNYRVKASNASTTIYSINGTFKTTSLFDEVTSFSIPQLTSSSIAWGDYNNDDHLDFLIMGKNEGNQYTKLFKNNGNGGFNEQTDILLVGGADGKIFWCDLNNDGFLDIFWFSYNEAFSLTKMYRNMGNGTFSEIIEHGIPANPYPYGTLIDFNNDGLLDIIYASYASETEPNHTIELYKNNGNFTFSKQENISFPKNSLSQIAVGDLNKDGYLDLVIGFGGSYAKIFKNVKGESFIEQLDLNVIGNSFSLTDYNSDGYLDIIFSRSYDYPETILLRNNGNETFSKIDPSPFSNLWRGTYSWGDLNNDGNSDLLLTGVTNNNNKISRIYLNSSSYLFSVLDGVDIPDLGFGSAAMADFNNNGTLDFMISGENTSPMTKLFNNNATTINTPPTAPTELKATVQGNGATLSWLPASDNQTPQTALSYNVRIGTTPGGSNIVHPSSNLATGWRRIPMLGNANLNTSFIISNLAPGTYYWSVQSVDNGYMGGPFSSEGSFTIQEYPSVQTKDITLDYISNVDAEITWNKGDGNRRVAFLRQGTGLLPSPASNKRYTANSIFGSGEQLNGWYCIYDGTGDRVGVTGLTATTSYQVVVYEYNGQAGAERYLTSTANGNPLTFSSTVPPFVEINSLFSQLAGGSAIWGDYNNDSYLDLLLSGRDTNSDFFLEVYMNNGNETFTKTATLLNKFNGIAPANWSDLNNDGFLDIVVTRPLFNNGIYTDYYVTEIYQNVNGVSFSKLPFELPGIETGKVIFGDYDNDGNTDIFIFGAKGVEEVSSHTFIFKNLGNWNFILVENMLPQLNDPILSTTDYNNDGYLDFFLSGLTNEYSTYQKLLKNNCNQTFTEQNIISNMYRGDAIWGDIDNDGNIDYFINYLLYADTFSEIFRNIGDESFQKMNTYVGMTLLGSASFGDYTANGSLDLILTNFDEEKNEVKLYRNLSTGELIKQSSFSFIGVDEGISSWADINNNGKLDVLISGGTGINGYNKVTKLFRNQTARTNTPPTAPGNLRAQAKANAVTLSWVRATDAQTPAPGLTYNLYFKRLSDGKVFGAPMSDLVTGKRRLAAAGNKWHATTATYHDLEPGAYTWSVQAVDHSYAGGPFASEGSFIIVGPTAAYVMPASGVSRTSATLNALVVTPDIETTVQFQYGTAPTDYAGWITVDATPSTVSGTDPTAVQVSISGLTPETTYYFRVKANNTEGTIYSEVKPFYTNDPPQVTTGSVTNVGPFVVILHGAVMPRNLQASVQFEYGETAALGSKVNASPAQVSGSSNTSVQAEISGLKANFGYYYRISAESLSGIAYGATLQLTTAKAAPEVVLTNAGAITSTTAQVKALVVPHNLATSVSFEWGRKGEPYESWQRETLPGTVSTDGEVTATLTLEPNTTYSYRARAESEAGWCETSDGEVKTLVKAPTVTTLGATSFTGGKATLTGLVTPHNSPTTVRVMYGLSPALTGDMVTIYYSQTLSGNAPIEVALETQPLQPQTQYYFCVMAINSGGTTYGEFEGFNTSAPLASVNPATEVTLTTAMLSGTVNGNGYDTQYSFRYGTDPQLTQFTATDELSLSVNNMLTPVNADITGLEPNTRYYFRVVVTNQYGESRSPIGDLHTLCSWEITSTKPAGVSALCQGGSPTTYTTNSATATTYQWTVTPSAAGYISGSGTTGTMVWSSSFTGAASISVRGFNGVCTSVDSEPLVVTVNPNPQPLAISGDNTVCPGSQGIVYTVPSVSDRSYDWTATGGQVQHGKSTASAGVSWGLTSGLGGVAVTETVVSTGCSTTSTKPVTISGAPAPEKPSIRVKGAIRILVSSVNASAYQWYRDNVPIPEASKKFFVARQNHGSYAVEIGTGSCKTLSDLLPLSASAKGLEVEPLATVFPNPSRGQVSYEIAVEVEGLMLIRVLDGNGRQVYTKKVNKPEFYHSEQLSIPNLQPGVYSIEAVMRGEVVDTQKIVLQ